MAASTLLDTKTVTLNDILGNGKIYRVPQFQRDYSWDEDNWEDLWNDSLRTHQTQEPHYMGSVVLQGNGTKEFSIIDGQQRFTTLSLLALAVIDLLRNKAIAGEETEDNTQRADLLTTQYIGQKDPASLRYSSKLFLNENNNRFYQDRLVALKEPISKRHLIESERLLWEAFGFFQERIKQEFGRQSGEALAAFLTQVVGGRMMFIQITVENELNAYTVFETLNSRGVAHEHRSA